MTSLRLNHSDLVKFHVQAHPLTTLLSLQLKAEEFEVNRALASFNLHYFQISMDPLACFFVLILGGEVYETAKLLRGHWFGLRGPIRLFGFLSL